MEVRNNRAQNLGFGTLNVRIKTEALEPLLKTVVGIGKANKLNLVSSNLNNSTAYLALKGSAENEKTAKERIQEAVRNGNIPKKQVTLYINDEKTDASVQKYGRNWVDRIVQIDTKA